MGLITWLLVGALAGFIFSMVAGKGNTIMDIIFGAVGGGLGGFIATLFGLGAIGTFGWANLFIALGAAVVVLVVWKLLGSRLSE